MPAVRLLPLLAALLLTGCAGEEPQRRADRPPAPAPTGPGPSDPVAGYLVACAGTGSAGRARSQEVLRRAQDVEGVTGVSVQSDGERYGVLVELFPPTEAQEVRRALEEGPDPLVLTADLRLC